jgi:hypothetical protein
MLSPYLDHVTLEHDLMFMQMELVMSKKNPLSLYHRYYSERDNEGLDLFQLLADKYRITSALYPGSYTHVTPSFVFPKAAYVDSDKQALIFFSDPRIYNFINRRKLYVQDAQVRFHPVSYTRDFEEKDGSFDLLISLYAGFISLYCKRYLKIGGVLLVNNSHGDAGMASLDDAYSLIGVVNRRAGNHVVSEKNLDLYFVPKAGVAVTREYLESIKRGIGYKKSAWAYLFRRVQ